VTNLQPDLKTTYRQKARARFAVVWTKWFWDWITFFSTNAIASFCLLDFRAI